MKHYLFLHWEAAKDALRQLVKQPLSSVLILLMLAIAMTLPLTLYLAVQSSQTLLGKLNESPQITLYLEYSASEEDRDEVNKLLAADSRIIGNEFVGREQGLQELQESMGGQDLVSMLDGNPLPDVFIISPKVDLTPTEMETLQQDLAKLPMVEQAKLDTAWMQTLYRIEQFVHQVLWFLAITLSVAFVLVAHNTIRLQILSRKEEIEITKLLGAPASFIRRPFLYQAIWQGILATAVSLGLCAGLMRHSQPLVSQIFQPYGLNPVWRFFTLAETAVIVAIVLILGISGAWLATQQHLLSFKVQR